MPFSRTASNCLEIRFEFEALRLLLRTTFVESSSPEGSFWLRKAIFTAHSRQMSLQLCSWHFVSSQLQWGKPPDPKFGKIAWRRETMASPKTEAMAMRDAANIVEVLSGQRVRVSKLANSNNWIQHILSVFFVFYLVVLAWAIYMILQHLSWFRIHWLAATIDPNSNRHIVLGFKQVCTHSFPQLLFLSSPQTLKSQPKSVLKWKGCPWYMDYVYVNPT